MAGVRSIVLLLLGALIIPALRACCGVACGFSGFSGRRRQAVSAGQDMAV
jgi:hypothetical protein